MIEARRREGLADPLLRASHVARDLGCSRVIAKAVLDELSADAWLQTNPRGAYRIHTHGERLRILSRRTSTSRAASLVRELTAEGFDDVEVSPDCPSYVLISAKTLRAILDERGA